MTGARSSDEAMYWRGYERGVQSGHAAGYAEGVAALDDAADALARLRPSKSVEVAAARQRLGQRPASSLTPREIRVRAAQSWGLPVPEDLPEDRAATSAGREVGPVTEAVVAHIARSAALTVRSGRVAGRWPSVQEVSARYGVGPRQAADLLGRARALDTADAATSGADVPAATGPAIEGPAPAPAPVVGLPVAELADDDDWAWQL